jgi:hypothetical protein
MSKSIQIKIDEQTGEHYLDFNDIKHLFKDPDIVDSYSIELLDDGSMTLEFFDINDNKVIPDNA